MLRWLWVRVRAHVAPFYDPTVLLLLAIGLGVVLWLDPVMAKTIAQFALPFFAFAAAVTVVSWLLFPHVDLDEWIEEARKGNPVAGHLFRAIAQFMGLALIALALWAKA